MQLSQRLGRDQALRLMETRQAADGQVAESDPQLIQRTVEAQERSNGLRILHLIQRVS